MSSANETETFQHYQVAKRSDGTLWELGRGAMGITYKAFDTNLRTDVALKVINALHLDSETARARFQREARAAAGLRHRNVATVYHLGSDDQSFFYAMEFIDGETVEGLVKKKGVMAPIDALQIVVQIARALGAAAKQNLVHRDIKPANVMVTHEDEDEDQLIVKVIDFGLARPALGGEGSAHITMGGFVGTPQYASPEQLEEKDLDTRSDIYSLGITLWYMLAGKPPFTGPLGSVFIQQLTKDPPWDQLPDIDPVVRALLAHMLQKDPDKREQSPVELRREVEICIRTLTKHEQARSAAAKPVEIETDTHADTRDTATASSSETDFAVSGTDVVDDSSAPPGIDLEVASSSARTAALTLGSLLDGRYELVSLMGEGNNGRVFQARDMTRDGVLVAVKIFHADVFASGPERRRVEAEISRLKSAGHPNLLEVHSLDESGGITYLVTEWVNGFTLVDVLRSRGHLPLKEAAQLLVQAVAAADHARTHDLRRIELGLHQILAHFPTLPIAGNDTDSGTKTALSQPLEQWPAFTLKLDALGITREAGDSLTWGGDRTMMPASQMLGRDTQTSIRGFVEGSDLFALGLLLYELLNGAPPALTPLGDNAREARYVALPALNEAANMVLRRALSPNPGFASNTEFFEALMVASGLMQTPLAQAPMPVSTGGMTIARTLFDAPVAPSENLVFDEPPFADAIGEDDSASTMIYEERATPAPLPVPEPEPVAREIPPPETPVLRDRPVPADNVPAPVMEERLAPPPELVVPEAFTDQDSDQTLLLDSEPAPEAVLDEAPSVVELPIEVPVIEANAELPLPAEAPVVETKAVLPDQLMLEELPPAPPVVEELPTPQASPVAEQIAIPKISMPEPMVPENVVEMAEPPPVEPVVEAKPLPVPKISPVKPVQKDPESAEIVAHDRAEVSLNLPVEDESDLPARTVPPSAKRAAPAAESEPTERAVAKTDFARATAIPGRTKSLSQNGLPEEERHGSGSKLLVIAGAALVALLVVGGSVAFLSRGPSKPVRPNSATTTRPVQSSTNNVSPKVPEVASRERFVSPAPVNPPVAAVVPTSSPAPLARQPDQTPSAEYVPSYDAKPELPAPATTPPPTMPEPVVIATPAPTSTPADDGNNKNQDEDNTPKSNPSRRTAENRPRREPTSTPPRVASRPPAEAKPQRPKAAEAPRPTPPPVSKPKPTPAASTPRPPQRQPGLN